MKDRPTATLRITNIPNETTEIEIRALFAPYSVIRGVRLNHGAPGGRSRGFAFVDLSPGEVAPSMAALDGSMFRGAVIRLDDVSRGQLGAVVAGRHHDGVATDEDTRARDPLARFCYELASIEPAVTPAGGQGLQWHHYVLSCGASRITGLHHGTLEEVAAYATSCAQAFNVRSTNGKSRNPLVLRKK